MNTEAQHLGTTYQYLQEERQRLTTSINEITAETHRIKDDAAKNTGNDTSTASGRIDTFASIESYNRQIDGLNAKVDRARHQLAATGILIPEAYFARLDIAFPGENPEPYYFGKVGYENEKGEIIIYDWRSSIADLFYGNQSGNSHSTANGNDFTVKVSLRRQFKLSYNRLIAKFDGGSLATDSFLIDMLRQAHTAALTDITATIQTEQNTIIRNQTAEVLVVNGVAGSGKTSVLLQRIAYLRYQHRDDWPADSFLLMTPNDAFSQYVKSVLPNIGEENPVTITWPKLLRQVTKLIGFQTVSENDIDAQDRLQLIERFLQKPANSNGYFFAATDKTTDGENTRLKQLQIAWRREQQRSGENTDFMHWLNGEKLAKTVYQATALTRKQWLYLYLKITAYQLDHIKAVFIDECQDYIVDDLLLWRCLFKQSRLTLVGDSQQRLTAHGTDVAEIINIFSEDRRNSEQASLHTSYRSSGAITKCFSRYTPVDITGVQPINREVTTIKRATFTELRMLAKKFGEGTVAIITGTKEEAASLETLFDQAARHDMRGIQVKSVEAAKGFEFDHVIVVNTESAVFLAPKIGNNRLYVALSRATQELIVIKNLVI